LPSGLHDPLLFSATDRDTLGARAVGAHQHDVASRGRSNHVIEDLFPVRRPVVREFVDGFARQLLGLAAIDAQLPDIRITVSVRVVQQLASVRRHSHLLRPLAAGRHLLDILCGADTIPQHRSGPDVRAKRE
jgi:hypothetical protein